MPKTDRICIIGAGPGGLATALALKKAGYTHVTVYEKSGQAGGQVYSKKFRTPEGKEIIYELCAMQPMGSPHLNQIIKQYGLHYSPPKNIIYYSLVDRDVFFKISPKIFLSFSFYHDLIKLMIELFKHRNLWKPGFKNFARTDELAMPFEQWIDKKKFHSVIYFLLKYCINGFMSFQKPNKNIPACYGFKILMQCLRPPVRYINGVFKQITEGYQEIWNRVAQDVGVQYHAHISKIMRTANVVTVTINDKQLQFDKLIIACQEYTEFLDCTEDEKFVQAQKKTIGSLRVAFIVKNCPISGIMLFPDPLRGKREFQCIGVTEYGSFGDDLKLFTGSFVLPKESEDSNEKIIEAIKEVLPIFGGEFIEIVSIHKEKNYGGHFSSESIQNGIFEISEARQGVKNTFYVGELLSCPTNAVIVDYAYDLVKRFF